MGDHEWALLAKADADVFLWGPRDRPRLRSLGPKVLEALQGYNGEWYARAGRAHLRAARMEVGRATEEASRHFNVALGPWQQELLDATLVGTAEMVREGARLAKALRRGRVLTVDHPNGTRLELRLRGRSPRVEDGVVSPQDVAEGNNMTSVPSGWVAVALDERFAEGTFHADRPSFLPAHRAEGGEWTFQGGHLTSYRYRSGGEAFSTPYEKAPHKGRDLVGYLSIGLNPKIAAAPQLEDQARGVVCLTVGRNDELGGSTRVPFLSWLVLGGANVTVDGRPLLRAGDIV